MTVKYEILGIQKSSDGSKWHYIKCFYGSEETGDYAEFYMFIDHTNKQIKLESKEPWEGYANILTQAFSQAMNSW